MTGFDDDEDTPTYRHPLARRVVAAVAIIALLLSAIGVGIAIAQYQWGPQPGQDASEAPLPA